MLIFVDEERSYLSWLAHHRHGFVMDMLRKPTRKSPVLHRAACSEIKVAKSKTTHWTTGRHVKACSLTMDELLVWAEAESESEPVYCDKCKPTDAAPAGLEQRHLTKLGKDILDYVVEAAVVCLDQDADYDVSVGEIAGYLGKTPAQIRTSLMRLVEDDYLRIQGEFDPKGDVPSQSLVLPTADALRTLASFEQMSVRKVTEELRHLTDDDE